MGEPGIAGLTPLGVPYSPIHELADKIVLRQDFRMTCDALLCVGNEEQ